MRISLRHMISMGHRIVGHEGKCRFLHGHNYVFEIEVESMSLNDLGMVVDYGDLKGLLDEWDHKMILWDRDPYLWGEKVRLEDLDKFGIIPVKFNPTAENIAGDIRARIHESWRHLTEGSVIVRETDKTWAKAIW